MELHEIKVGNRTYPIHSFSPRKVLLASRMVAKLGKVNRAVAKELSSYQREYREENADIVTREMAAVPPWREGLEFMTPKDWDECGGKIEIRRDPPEWEALLVGLGAATDFAEEEVSRLLALVVIPNEELADAAKGKSVTEALDSYAGQFLDEADVGQLVDLVAASIEVVREELAGKSAKISKIRQTFLGKPETEAEEPTETELTEETASEDQQEDSSETKPPSSTDSPAPTDGPTETASTESPTAQPAPSPTS